MSKSPSSDDQVAQRRDEVIKRMINMPPKPHKSVSKRRPSPEVRQLPKRRTNKKRDKA